MWGKNDSGTLLCSVRRLLVSRSCKSIHSLRLRFVSKMATPLFDWVFDDASFALHFYSPFIYLVAKLHICWVSHFWVYFNLLFSVSLVIPVLRITVWSSAKWCHHKVISSVSWRKWDVICIDMMCVQIVLHQILNIHFNVFIKYNEPNIYEKIQIGI